MALRWLIRPNAYYDSVKLMRVSETLSQQPGVLRAAAVMATPLNVQLLADDGLMPPGAEPSIESLLVSVLGEDDAAADAAIAALDDILTLRQMEDITSDSHSRAYTVEQAAALENANIAVIAVPGAYAAAEAYSALRAGLHVFLFSDNVSVDDEIRLKRLAIQNDLLMMGPDCGTAILGGVGLGFANRTEPGPVGIVGASGTGIQQVCCLLDEADIGIACAIGTGGRDLSAGVGGSMTMRALWALDADDSVQIIALISKPADPEASRRLQQHILHLTKPAVVCLMGEKPTSTDSIQYTTTLTEMAAIISQMLHIDPPASRDPNIPRFNPPKGGQVYGLFAGGTLASEATQILKSHGVPHHLIDLGADEYTRGRAHPIIDPRLRVSMMEALAQKDDRVAVLVDVILGDLAHPDPAATLAPIIQRLAQYDDGSHCAVCVVLVGTKRDKQGLDRQRAVLQDAGAVVFTSNADAAVFAAHLARSSS